MKHWFSQTFLPNNKYLMFFTLIQEFLFHLYKNYNIKWTKIYSHNK